MKHNYPKVSLGRFCRLLGVTRQSYYQHFWQQEQSAFEEELVLSEVLIIRKKHRRMGGRKLYELLNPFLLEHQIKMGRDRLFDVLSANYLLIKLRKKQSITTNSFHRFKKYPNLIRNFIPSSPNQLWVSDITYWRIKERFLYISFITDAYSRKIVGYHLGDSLQTSQTIQALQLAILNLTVEGKNNLYLTHHSDRGTQYCSNEYVLAFNINNYTSYRLKGFNGNDLLFLLRDISRISSSKISSKKLLLSLNNLNIGVDFTGIYKALLKLDFDADCLKTCSDGKEAHGTIHK